MVPSFVCWTLSGARLGTGSRSRNIKFSHLPPIKAAVIFYPHITQYGGIERNIVGLAGEVVRRGLRPVLLCYYDQVGMERYAEGLEVCEIGDSPLPWVKAQRLASWLTEKKSVLAGLPFFLDTKAGFYGALARLNRCVFHYTDPPSLLSRPDPVSGVRKLLQGPRARLAHTITRAGVHRAHCCITMTSWNAQELQELYGRAFEVVYQGGVPSKAPTEFSRRCTGPALRLFSICRLAESKNLDWILHLIKKLRADVGFRNMFPDVQAVIAGEGPTAEKLKEHARSLSPLDSVSFPGFLSPEQVEQEFAAAGLFLVPERQGFGLPVLEALYRRVPVVLNRESRISEILENHPWAAVSDNSCESFAEAAKRHLLAIRDTPPDEGRLDDLPTERGWATLIGQACNWW